jgi:hypothetical protein
MLFRSSLVGGPRLTILVKNRGGVQFCWVKAGPKPGRRVFPTPSRDSQSAPRSHPSTFREGTPYPIPLAARRPDQR